MKICKVCGKPANTDRLLCKDCYKLHRNGNLDKELPIGKDFIHYEKRFIVTEDAKVFSTITFKYLKPTIMKNGYLMYTFGSASAGTRVQVYAHRLVAYCYGMLDDLFSPLCIDHIDRDKTNNLLSNLRVVSYSENELHKKQAQGMLYAHKDGCVYGPYVSVKEMYTALKVKGTLGSFYTQVSRKAGYGYTFTREDTEVTTA